MELVCTLSPHAHTHTYTAARRRHRRLNARTLQHAVLVGSSLACVWLKCVCAHVALTAYVCSFPSRLLLIESWRPLLLAIAALEDDRMVVAAWRFFSPMRPIHYWPFYGQQQQPF